MSQSLEHIWEMERLRVEVKKLREENTKLQEVTTDTERDHENIVKWWVDHTAPGNPHHSIYEWLEWLWSEHSENLRLAAVVKNLDGPTIMRDYDLELREHPHFKRFIEHTPFENDCGAIAWAVVRRHLPKELW